MKSLVVRCLIQEKSFKQVVLEEQAHAGPTKIALEIKGISETGFLTAVDTKGETFELHPDGNRFCFLMSLQLNSRQRHRDFIQVFYRWRKSVDQQKTHRCRLLFTARDQPLPWFMQLGLFCWSCSTQSAI